MNILFIIGGTIVLAGITYMTVAYYRTARELRLSQLDNEMLRYQLEKEQELNEGIWKALLEEPNADVRYGDF